MSIVDDDEDPWKALGANPVEMCAAAWCERRDHKDWNERDQAELDEWLATSPAHVVAYLRMAHAWNRADRLAALKLPAAERAIASSKTHFSSVVRRGAVGAIAIGMIGAAFLFFFSGSSEKKYATAIGGHKVVVLADGSQVELNTDTQLHLIVDAHRRTAVLDKGEAFFQIKHDAAHPFVVIANGHRVTDLGTKFLVRREADRLSVSVLEGRIEFEAAANAKPALLAPGDIAIATANSLSVTRRPAPELSTELGWRHGVLVFRHTTLQDAAAEFNRYNREKLIIADAATARLTIDGTFPTNNTRAFTRLAREVFGLRVVNDTQNETVISR